MEQKQISIQQKEDRSTARRKSYLTYMERYPLYSTLLVLQEYEDQELYEECAIIKSAIEDYKSKYENKIPKEIGFPTQLSTYMSKEHQDTLKKYNINIEEESAKEKATLIKLNLPVKNGL